MPREATDMDFINNRPVQRLGRKCWLTPVIMGICYNPAQSVGRRDCLTAIPIFIAHRQRPRIQYFPPGAVRPLYPPGVMRAKRQLLDENMPCQKSPLRVRIECNHLERFSTFSRLVEQQLDTDGIVAKNRKIGSFFTPGSTAVRAGRHYGFDNAQVQLSWCISVKSNLP